MKPNRRNVNDYQKARERMVQKQLVDRGIRDERVIEAMRTVPRHLFVEPAFIDRAYEDDPLPIGQKQTISQPYIVAFMMECLELKGTERVLDIGTGSGYQAAVLAQLCSNVFSVEKISTHASHARTLLDELGLYNIAIHVGDGTLGWSEHAPYDAIVVAAGAPAVPPPLIQQLSRKGRLIIPIGDQRSQNLTLHQRTATGVVAKDLGACRFVKLLGRYGWPA